MERRTKVMMSLLPIGKTFFLYGLEPQRKKERDTFLKMVKMLTLGQRLFKLLLCKLITLNTVKGINT